MTGLLPPPSDRRAAIAARFVAAISREGLTGPVFVVTTDDLVGVWAPAWAEAFARVGWHHRVRVIARLADGAEIADIAVEIDTFAAGAIVVAAAVDLVTAVRSVAGARAPLVVDWPAPPLAAERNPLPAD